ncbi:MAG TPA: lysophospholipid acyltransferase family protein [Steroidobacteraceae bacterium]
MPTDPEDAGGLRNTLYKKETRSKRRMTPARRFVWKIVAAIGVFLLKSFWRTCRVVRVVGDEHTAAALAASPSLIPVYWHQHQMFCAKYLLEQRSRGLKLGFLISPSVDGDIGVMVVSYFGGHSIRGSTTHTGARALRDYYDALVKQGISPSITPDGPKGPRFVFKPGAILLSQMSQRPILPMAWCASRATLFAWDKFVLPWPFSRIVIAVGPPRQVPRTMQPAALEAMQLEMAAELNRLFGVARDSLSAP